MCIRTPGWNVSHSWWVVEVVSELEQPFSNLMVGRFKMGLTWLGLSRCSSGVLRMGVMAAGFRGGGYSGRGEAGGVDDSQERGDMLLTGVDECSRGPVEDLIETW